MRKYLEKVKRNWDSERQRREFNNQKELSKKNNLNQKRILFFRQKLEDEKPFLM